MSKIVSHKILACEKIGGAHSSTSLSLPSTTKTDNRGLGLREELDGERIATWAFCSVELEMDTWNRAAADILSGTSVMHDM